MLGNWWQASVAGLLVLTCVPPAGGAENGAVTPWVEAQAARVRLLAGADPTLPGQSVLAGVEITMAEGWKTYWRNPGEAGVPPNFDWSGSTNTASIKVACADSMPALRSLMRACRSARSIVPSVWPAFTRLPSAIASDSSVPAALARTIAVRGATSGPVNSMRCAIGATLG